MTEQVAKTTDSEDQEDKTPEEKVAVEEKQEDKPSETDGTDWKAEAEKWKALSRKNEGNSKVNQDELEKVKQELTEKNQELLTFKGIADENDKLKVTIVDLQRAQVAAEKGLSETLKKRLTGSTIEEMLADADDLLEGFKSSKTSKSTMPLQGISGSEITGRGSIAREKLASRLKKG